MNTAERDQRLQDLLLAALESPPDDRRQALLDLGEDPTLIDTALALLAEEDAQFLAQPPSLQARDRLPVLPGYRIEGLLGEGGMGRVFLAEEEGDTRRRVAIKMIRAPFVDAELVERFAAERQALARLNHPAIAQLYAADSTLSGQPFVVMEYVEGLPLTSYCDLHRLSIEQRLRLFLAICRGVEHAHRRLLLHRDLKPSNLLVTQRDGEAMPKTTPSAPPKALDGGRLDGAATLTGASILGTPSYMSPEALRPVDGTRDLDTRSDVYSLGVVLYELLVGARPYPKATNDPRLTDWIVNHDPKRPSARWHSLDEQTRAESAAARGLEPARMAAALGDLDWIVMKAIDRERDRRYGSAAELAADLDRYVRHEPIEARPPSLGYRLTCLTRRHRTAVLAASLVALSLVLGALGATLGMLRAQAAEEKAQLEALRASREATTATRVSDMLVDLFAIADPSKGGPSTTMELGELLDRGSASIRDGLDEEPAIRARLMSVLGDIYRVVGDYESSRQHLEEALELWQADPDPDAYRLGQTLNHLAVLDRNIGSFESAAERLERASVLWASVFGPEHDKIAGLLNNQGNVLRELGRYEEAAVALESALTIWEKTLGPEHRSVGIAALNLGNVWNQVGAEEKALDAYRRAGLIFEALVGADHPHLGVVQGNIADVLGDLGRFGEAEVALREALRIRLSAFGPEHDHTARTQRELGRCLLEQGKLPAAEELLTESLATLERVHGPSHLQVAITLTDLAELRRLQGRAGEGIPLARRAVELLEAQPSEDETNLHRARRILQEAREEADS